MPNPYFRFKQFTVYHDKCAMKVGTDGVLLGAWVDVDKYSNVLDVGTGSGLIALMMAQRNKEARIDAIEIDQNAALQSNENFGQSPFRNISGCLNISFDEFAKSATEKYDLIVCNPPFFNHSLKSPDEPRNIARHTDSLYIDDFIELSLSILAEKGSISFIYPYSEKENLLSLAKERGLSVSRITDVYSTPQSQPKRILLELRNENCITQASSLIIENERHVYSANFTALVKDFYLKL